MCRNPHTLEQMIPLYPAWEDSATRDDARQAARPVSPEETVSSSPDRVRLIDYEAEQTVDVIKRAIAGQVDPEDAFLA